MSSERLDKFLALVSDETSDFEKKVLLRKENKEWIKKSTQIAIKVNSAIKMQSISQKQLAEKLHVSAQYVNKMLKGSENLSLETISKLERALGIQLIEVIGYTSSAYSKPNNSILSTVNAPQITKTIRFTPKDYSNSETPCVNYY
jgi:ribosome-binding protein aMBF1 (putative translation factor)